MAISPPSDLVLDVVRAADPTEVQAAQEKLKTSRASYEAASLAEKGAGFEAAVGVLNGAANRAGLGNVSAESSEVPETYRQFEAVVLQNFVKSMLPSDSEAVFGKGNAGEMWKSMMAEQIGEVLSERGGVGIAEQMFSDEVKARRGKDVVNVVTDEDDRSVAMNMLTDLERRTLGVSSTEQAQA